MRIGKKLLAALLSLLLFVELMPLQVFAADVTDNAETVMEDVDGSYEETEAIREILGEVEEYRDADTKHFLNTDGSYTAVKYAQPVHYRTTAEGEWLDIDNTLVLTDADNAPGVNRARQAGSDAFGQDITQVYVPQSSPVDVVLAKDSGGAYVATLNSGTHTLSWRYAVDRSGAQPEALTRSDAQAMSFASDDAADESAETRAVRNVTRGLVYPNVAANVDLEYILDSVYLKENVVLKTPSAANSFRLTYAVGDLTAQQVSEQEIALRDADGETVFTLYAPCMVDANMAASGGVTLKLLSEQNGELTVQLTADSAWLQDPARSYPVRIDPYVFQGVVSFDQDATAIYKPHSSTESIGTLMVGYDNENYYGKTRSYVQFTLPELAAGDMVINSRLNVCEYLGSYGYDPASHDSFQINAYQVTYPWTAQAIQTSTSYNNLPSMNDTVIDYQVVSSSTCGTWVTFDVTRQAKEWYESESTNCGICLEAANPTEWVIARFIASNNTAYPTLRPTLEVDYLNNRGLEGRWTNHTQSLGRSGSSYINDYTGNLVFISPLVSTTGNRMPVSISLVYNGFQHKENVGRPNIMGYGWRLNIQEKIIPITSNGSDLWATLYAEGYRYIYEDGDGTQHYFTKKNDSGTICEDEEGMGLTLEKYSATTNGERYEIRSDAGGKMTFTEAGYLSRVIDADNNAYQINYSSSDRIDSVTDGAGRDIIFTYSASTGPILSITDPSNRETKFYYSSGNYHNLIKIEYPDGAKTKFTYDSEDRMTEAKGTDGGALRYTYSDSTDNAVKNRVASVTEYSNDTNPVAGNSLAMDYSAINQTIFTYDQNNDNEKKEEVYQFDNYGRTVGIRDAAGNMGAYKYVSDASELSNKTANALKSASVGTKFVNNRLRNHSFERSTNSNWSKSSGSAAFATDAYYLGAKSMKLTGSGAWATQDVSVTAGYFYTFSAYVKTGAASTNAAVSMEFLNASGNTLSTVTSNPIDYETADWQRICVSGQAPTGAVTVRVRCMTGGTGSAWFDCVQLEMGASVNPYNLVENGSFSDSGVSVWTMEGNTGSDGRHWNDTDGYHYQLSGSASTTKRVIQTIPINRVGNQTFLTISARGKASSVPLSGNGRRFSIGVRAHYPDGSTGSIRWANFNPDYSADWQYTARTAGFQTSATIDYIEVFCAYDKNANTAYFDNVQVNLDETGVTYTYDEDGNLTSAKDNASRNQTYTYNNANEITNVNTVDNKNYTFTYDDTYEHRLLSAVSQSSAVKISLNYDSYGNVTSTKVGKSNGTGKYIKQYTTYADSGNYVDKVYNDRGYATDYDYNTYKGTLSRVTDANGNVTNYTYNANNDRLLTVSGSGATVTYSYDTAGHLVKLETPSTDYTFTYDSFGNALTTEAEGYTLVTNDYDDPNGNLTQTEYGNGDRISYEYDNLDRVTKIFYNNETESRHKWAYNAAGQVGRYWDKESGKNYTYTYDDLGRPLRVDVSDGSWIQSGYNTLDLSTQQRYRYAGVTRTVSYAYSDRDNLPLTATFYGGGGKVTNSYDDLTRLSQKSYRANGSDTGVTATYRYVDWTDTNNTNRTSGTVRGIIYGYDDSQLTVSDLYYDYDGAGNVTAERAWGTNSKPLREQYTYDGKNQLIRHDSKTQGFSFTYTYDNAGNITSVKKYDYVENGGALGAVLETKTYSYDDSSWKDLLTAYNGHTITHDAMGNMTSYNGSTYTWEGRQLKTIQGGGNTYSYTYNADGIRTGKTVNGTTTEYFLNGSQILAQKTGSETLWFFYDSTGQRVAVLCGGVLYYYVYNLQGDVIALAGATTGRILVKYSYDAWGNCTVTDDRTSTHVGEKNPFRYRGYYLDNETGMYYLNSRYYSPEFGRFISADVYVSTGQGLLSANMFAYCENNPVNRADNGGKAPEYALDINEDGVDDCFVYSYTYKKGILWWRKECVGHVYIYTGVNTNYFEESNNRPTNFNNESDLMVGDFTKNENPNMYAYQAQNVRKENRSKIVDILFEYDEDFNTSWMRTKKSVLSEWKSHSFYAFASERAQNIDFDNAEEGAGFLHFTFKALKSFLF